MGLEAPGERDDEEGGEGESRDSRNLGPLCAWQQQHTMHTKKKGRMREGKDGRKVGWAKRFLAPTIFQPCVQRSAEVEVRGLVKFAPAL